MRRAPCIFTARHRTGSRSPTHLWVDRSPLLSSSAEARTWQAANDTAGIEQLVARLQANAPALVVLEATGGYEFDAACALQAAGLAVAVVNPRTARDFARAMGRWPRPMRSTRACWRHQHPERERFVKPLAGAELQRLQALVLRRRQIVPSCPSSAASTGAASPLSSAWRRSTATPARCAASARRSGARATVRRTLYYMATLTAVRHNPVLRLHYERLLGAGKRKKVAPSWPACASC